MSLNSYCSYFCYPGYNRNCCYSTCNNLSYNPCNTQCANICQPQLCQPLCQPICPPCPTVVFISNTATVTSIPSGGTLIAPGTTIPAGSTTVPANSVTVIAGFTGTPTTNTGGVINSNGFFLIPISGRYVITGNVCFSVPATVAPGDFRELILYRVDATTGLVTQLAIDSRVPLSNLPTCINLSTNADLNAGDRVFLAARQVTVVNGLPVAINANADGRIAITRVC